MVSIVVPTLNEATRIESCLRRLRGAFPDCELVVVDGGSTDGTVALAARYAQVAHSAAGRATQMNAGAAVAIGDLLWFIHADCQVHPDALGLLRRALLDPGVVGGGLRLRFDQRGPGLDYLAASSNLRARRLSWIFGDQAMFVRREVFDSVGGFPEIPLMEDLEMSRILRRRGRLAVLPTSVTASARRLVEQGPWRMCVLMQWLKLQYLLGADPERIRRRYEAGTRRGRRLEVSRGEHSPSSSNQGAGGWADGALVAPGEGETPA
ncbi:MAG: TIGR04283 family arsenosugar biosynthesis glycosyltransferase [Pseudonocardiaceae bacterium]